MGKATLQHSYHRFLGIDVSKDTIDCLLRPTEEYSQMRSCMTMVARSVSHHYERFARYKQRKLEEGKPWPVIRNNLINKMIKITCAIWNSGQPYRQDYEARFNRQKNAA